MSNPPAVRQAPGVTYSQLENGIHVFRFVNNRRETADVWQTWMHEIISQNPPGLHFRALYDIRGIWLTPYAIRTAVAISRFAPRDMPTSTAVVVGDSLGGSLIQALLKQFAQHRVKMRRVFTSEVEAMAWIDRRHEQQKSA